MKLKEKIKLIKTGKLTAVENIKNFLNEIEKNNKKGNKINAVLVINDKALQQAREIDEKIKKGKAGKLAGLGFIAKSNINVKDLICNCASRTLENYKATYNATVIDKLLLEDAIVLGMANMDEFACGASGETSAFGFCKNPAALDRVPGGSSSGSAASVSADFCDFSLGSDTGGSIRNPSSHCGIVGFKPTYGTVSRYGLIDLSMSLDQIGPLSNHVEDIELIYSIIKGKDENDASSFDYPLSKINKKIRVGVLNIKADKEIWDLVRKKVNEICKLNKWDVNDIKLNYMDLGIQTYYPIVYVEFFSGTRKFDGRKYGKIIEESCGEEVLRRILGGSIISKEEFAGKYYRKALQAKKLISDEFENAFKKFDILILPTVPRLPHKIGTKISIEDMYDYDSCTVLANLAEIPGISVPCGEINNIPVGLQILAKKGNDNNLLEIATRFER